MGTRLWDASRISQREICPRIWDQDILWSHAVRNAAENTSTSPFNMEVNASVETPTENTKRPRSKPVVENGPTASSRLENTLILDASRTRAPEISNPNKNPEMDPELNAERSAPERE